MSDDTRLRDWFDQHEDLIGEGSTLDNAIRLLDHAYAPDGCEDPRNLSVHVPTLRRVDEAGDVGRRAADVIADLADAMDGIRKMLEGELDRERRDRQREDERSGERDPARWQEALADLQAVLRGSVTMARNANATIGNGDRADENLDGWLADYLTREIDRRLRNGSGWSLKYALQTLGGDPPKDLRAEAEKFADQHGADGPARAAAIEAYLAGAGMER